MASGINTAGGSPGGGGVNAASAPTAGGQFVLGDLPNPVGHVGEFLKSNGAVPVWAALTGGGDLLAANALSELVSRAAAARASIGAAPLVSPAFTSVPTAPTAAPGTSTTQVATTAFAAAAVATEATARAAADALLAPLANPALTGTPTAPTAATVTTTTQLATTAFVHAVVAALINGAPGALDTLKELADALGDDAAFAATVTNALALKAPLTSPDFQGTPTVPTPSPGANDTSVATTAFVAAALTAAIAAAFTARLTASAVGALSTTWPDPAGSSLTLLAAFRDLAGRTLALEDANSVPDAGLVAPDGAYLVAPDGSFLVYPT